MKAVRESTQPGSPGVTQRQGPPPAAASPAEASFRRTDPSQRGAITVEYALVMLIAAAILMGVEVGIFRPMAVEVFKDFMGFIAPPYP